MAALGRLVAELGLDSAQFTEGLKRAQKGLDDFRASINGAAGAALGSFAGQLIALETASRAADASMRAFTDTVKGLSALDDAAEKTGATVENLSRLEAQSIISGQAFGALEGALIKLNKGLTNADEETKGAGKALEYLGVSARDANGNLKDAAEITEEVAKKLSEFSDKGPGKAALALELYGKAGAELLPYLKDLADSGDLVTRVTAKQASEAENYEKGLKRLGLANLDLKRQVVSEILPVANQFIESLIAQKRAGEGLQKTIKELTDDGSIRRWTENAIVFVGQVIDVARAIPTAFKMAGVFIAGLAVEAVTAGEVFLGVAKAITSLGNGAAQAKGIDDARAALARLGQGAAFAQEDFDKLADSFTKNSFADKFRAAFGPQVPDSLRAIEGAMDRANKKIAGFKPVAEKASKEAEAFAKSLESLINKIQGKDAGVDSDFAKNLETLDKALAIGKISLGQYNQLLSSYIVSQKVVVDAEKKRVDALEALDKITEHLLKLNLEQIAADSKTIAAAADVTRAYEEENRKLTESIEQMGLSAIQINNLNIAKLRAKLVTYELAAATGALEDADAKAAKEIEAQIDLLEKRNGIFAQREEIDRYANSLQGLSGFFEDLFLNGKKAFDDLGQTVKRFFAQLAAQFASKFVLNIAASVLGLGGAGTAGASGLGILGNLFGAAGSTGASGLLGSLGGVMGLGSGAGLLGTVGAGAQLGLTGLASGTYGSAVGLAGSSGGLAGTIGSLLPVLIPLAIVAGLAAYFSKDEKGIKFDNSLRNIAAPPANVQISALGNFAPSGDVDANTLQALQPFLNKVKELDNFIAKNLFTDQTLADVRERIQAVQNPRWWNLDDKGAIEKASKYFLQQRYSIAFDALEAGAGDLIRNFEGTADELLVYIQKLGNSAYTIAKLNDAVPGLNLTIAAFSKLTDTAQQAFTSLALSIDAFNTNTNQTVADLIDSSSRGVVSNYERQAEAMLTLRDGLADGSVSIEDFATGIGNLATAYAQATSKIADTKRALEELFTNSQEGFLLQSLSVDEKYAYYQQQAEALYAQLANATDPEVIDRLARKIDSLQNAAFGLLSPEQQGALAGDFISGSQRVEDLVNARLAAAGDLLDKNNANLREVIRDALADFAAQIKAVADQEQDTANINLDAANTPQRLDIIIHKDGEVEVGQI